MVEKCREIEQVSRIAFNIMIDEKKQRGIFLNNIYFVIDINNKLNNKL